MKLRDGGFVQEEMPMPVQLFRYVSEGTIGEVIVLRDTEKKS